MIIIPMAGLSSRFFKAGFNKPKYQLEVGGVTVFSRAVKSFENYFNTEKFVFVVRDVFGTNNFVRAELQALGVVDFELVCLPHETRGQAETVYLASKSQEDSPLTIFNIDTFRYDYSHPEFLSRCDGYLEVFSAPGEQWSFVDPIDDENVGRTTEKQRISDLCSNGLYYFSSSKRFESLFEAAEREGRTVRGEYYIAPLYNDLIADGGIVKYRLVGISQMGFCGTPEEYFALGGEKCEG